MRVPWAFLRFVAETQFSHGARSISNLVDLIPLATEQAVSLDFTNLGLPLNSEKDLKSSNLRYHIKEKPAVTIKRWQDLSNTTSLVICAYSDNFWHRGFDWLKNELRKSSI